MEIKNNNYNYNPAFKMKLVAPERWNPQVLKTFRKSQLAKDLDRAFPNATAEYCAYGNDQRVCNLFIELSLGKKGKYTISAGKRRINNASVDFPAMHEALQEKIDKLNIHNVLYGIAKRNYSLEKRMKVCQKAEEFGKSTTLKIKNRFDWEPEVLEAFMDSKFALDLKKAYPHSRIKYKCTSANRFENSASITVKNADGQEYAFRSYGENTSEELINSLSNTTMKELRRGFEEYESQRSPFVKFLRRMFPLP